MARAAPAENDEWAVQRARYMIPAARRADWCARRVGVAAAREINEIPAARRPTEESRFRAAGMKLETIVPLGDDPLVSLPALAT